MTTLAREFDACGECRLEVGGPDKYRTLSDDEIREVVEALDGLRLANAVARDIPEGWELRLCIERGAAWVTLHRNGERIELPDCADKSLEEEVNDAMAVAMEGTWIDCDTCKGIGTIDERLGGEWNSNPQAKCPDCDGVGEVRINRPNVKLTGAERASPAKRPG